MSLRLAVLLASAIGLTPAIAETAADRWNLSELHPWDAAWSADAAKLEAQMKELAACKGHLGDNAARFKKCLGLQADMGKRYARMNLYSSEQLAGDTGAAAFLELSQKAEVLGARLNEASSFMSPEILRLGRNRITRFVAQDASLKIYRHPLDEILRLAPQTLDSEGESLVAQFGLMSGAGGSTYSILTNADIPWPTIKLSTGEEVRLDASAYTKYREAPNRDDRKRVMDEFFGTFKTFERTLGITHYSQLKEESVYGKVRKYPDSITRALDRNKVPPAVYAALIASTNANLPTLHRYFRLRAKMLGVAEMRYYDIYPPLVSGGREYAIDEGVQMMLAAVRPLGEDYVAAMRKGVESRWMDVYPRPRKLSGAHMAGSAYDVHPYLLINHTGNYASVSTLVHEWGHAMHSYFSNKAQPFPTAGYAIFVAEIASTLNEALLLDYALKSAKSDEERLLYLGSALEELRGTFFRQAMFGEFEQKVHGIVDSGQPLTGEQLSKIYGELLRRYHGEAQGVVKIDDLYTIEWAYIPHFYNAFYVFQYATSISAGSLFADDILAGKPGARERYLKLISSGGADYPYDLVKKAGVDLANRAPYDAVAKRMNRIMDDMEAILARRK